MKCKENDRFSKVWEHFKLNKKETPQRSECTACPCCCSTRAENSCCIHQMCPELTTDIFMFPWQKIKRKEKVKSVIICHVT